MDPIHNQRTVIFQSDLFEIVSIDWTDKSTSGVHNHGWSQCLVLVQEGVFENQLDLGIKMETKIFEVGEVMNTPMGGRHLMKCLSPKGKTLHVYTPKISELSEKGRFSDQISSVLESTLKLSEATSIRDLRHILEAIKLQSVTTHSPYFMNQLFSGIIPQSIMADEILTQTKTTLATVEASPVFSKIEDEVVSSLGELIGWDVSRRGGLCVPGGSAANFMALHCARHNKDADFKITGMKGHKFAVYASSDAHYSIRKACIVLGLGSESLKLVNTDSQGRLDTVELRILILENKKIGIEPLMVCATAGTTVLGAFDPIGEIADICQEYKIWFHIDAAWGGPALFSARLRPLIAGIERADSVTFDAHKVLGASLTCSFFLTSQGTLLLEANDVSGADYLFHDKNLDLGKLSWQCGRSAEALKFWTIWKSVGTQGFDTFIGRLLNIRDEALEWIKLRPRLKLVQTPSYLNICLRVIPLEGNGQDFDWSRKVREKLVEGNLAMVNYSQDKQGTFLRLILAHPFLEFRHIQGILEMALEL